MGLKMKTETARDERDEKDEKDEFRQSQYPRP